MWYYLLTINLVLFLKIANARCAAESPMDPSGKIINGTPVTIDKFPYAVKFYNNDSLCAGSILTSWSVLTAAHCFDRNKNLDDMLVVAGHTFIQKVFHINFYYVHSFVIHENYNKKMRFAADIALLFQTKPFKFSNLVQKALVVDNLDWMKDRQKIEVIGWGWTQPKGHASTSGLMRTVLHIIPQKECEKNHKMKFSNDMFCLYGNGETDSCMGDSGGGVSWNGRIVGIVSHGYGCAIKSKPSVYINLFVYRDWIGRKILQFYKFLCKQKDQKRLSH